MADQDHSRMPHGPRDPVDREFFERCRDRLSETTLRAKWITSPTEPEDYPGQLLATRRLAVIKHWAHERNAFPAPLANTASEGQGGELRLKFPGRGGRELEVISWDEWFETFDTRECVFVFQRHKRDGTPSSFYMLDNPGLERE